MRKYYFVTCDNLSKLLCSTYGYNVFLYYLYILTNKLEQLNSVICFLGRKSDVECKIFIILI